MEHACRVKYELYGWEVYSTSPSKHNVVQWGSLTLKFSTCEAATASLVGKDGEQDLSLRLLGWYCRTASF